MSDEQFFLRVEAVNLANFVYDTNKIQPMRGGGFLLLESVRNLVNDEPPGKQPEFNGVSLEKITTGASIGIFSFSNTSDPQKVADQVLERLNKDTGGHATFVVDWMESTGKFADDLEVLQAKNRWRQYQQPTLVLPAFDPKGNNPCAWDGVRPGVEPWTDPDDKKAKPISSSVKFRKEKGSDFKKEMYDLILGYKINDKFTDELHELANNQDKDNLNDKIAFIYFDGNKFSKIRKRCDTDTKMTAFSDSVETPRITFIKALLNKAAGQADFMTGDYKIRLETLLWGGDEFEIIVPAWKGWEAVKLFMDSMKDAKYDDVALTHAGGIVFCGCKAPIRLVRKMARDLAEEVKESLSGEFKDDDLSGISHEKHDRFHLLTLESFDTVGTDIGQFAKSYYGADAWKQMQLGLGDMEMLYAALELMHKYDFPRNKIFEIVRAVKCGDDTAKINKKLKDALAGNSNSENIITAIDAFLDGNSNRWYLIADLWDYVEVKP